MIRLCFTDDTLFMVSQNVRSVQQGTLLGYQLYMLINIHDYTGGEHRRQR